MNINNFDTNFSKAEYLTLDFFELSIIFVLCPVYSTIPNRIGVFLTIVPRSIVF